MTVTNLRGYVTVAGSGEVFVEEVNRLYSERLRRMP